MECRPELHWPKGILLIALVRGCAPERHWSLYGYRNCVLQSRRELLLNMACDPLRMSCVG